ncbi:hypothetical protein MMC26_000368 [Xylographa opegraphella]|nr:hypothetical protein [Xylographa opegraphella]
MDIDPRLREASTTAGSLDTRASKASDAYRLASTSYTLNPIRLPPPQNHSSGLPPLLHEANHPYYAIQHDSAPPDILPRRQLTPVENVPPLAVLPQISSDRKDEIKRPRACEACRGLKVRCVPDPTSGTCRRCAKAGRQCVVTLPTRKRQKKTDTRVAELEKKIDALTASLQATKNQVSSESDGDSSDEEPRQNTSATYTHDSEDQLLPGIKVSSTRLPHGDVPIATSPSSSRPNTKRAWQFNRDTDDSTRPEKVSKTRSGESGPMSKKPIEAYVDSHKECYLPASNRPSTQVPLRGPPTPGHEYADVVDRKIIDAEAATTIFDHYKSRMAPHMPAVVFPENIMAGEVRRTKPILFLAILSVASYHEYPKTQKTLLREITRVYAESIICRGEKSLELVQALQVSTIWYIPEDYRDAKPYLFVNMAVSMAIALGLSQKRRSLAGLSINGWRENMHPRSSAIDKTAVDNYRAWLACFLLGGITALGLKQANFIPWSPYLDDCVHVLETSSEAMSSDKLLSLAAKLQRIKDDIVIRFETENKYLTTLSHNPDSSVEIMSFRKRLDDWLTEKPKEFDFRLLTLAFSVSDMHLHQIDVRHRYNVEGLDGTNGLTDVNESSVGSTLPKPAEPGAVRECLKSIHRVLDIFLGFSIQDVQTIPTFHFLRIAYAVVCLVRLHRAATKTDSEIGRVIPTRHMDVEGYISRLLTLMQRAAADEKSRPAQNFQLALRMIMIWFKRQNNCQSSLKRVEVRTQNFKLEARPVDTGRRTPGSGYRKISIPTTDKSSGPTTPRDGLKVRTPSITMPDNPDEKQQPLSSLPQQQESSHQYQRYNCPPLQAGSTPLDLLSHVATSDTSASAYHLSTTGTGDGWYNNNNNNNNSHSTYSQVPSAPGTAPQPYVPWNESYYLNQSGYSESAQSAANVDPMYQGMTMEMDIGLEQAIGQPFAEEADLIHMFMGDPFTNNMPLDYMATSGSW